MKPQMKTKSVLGYKLTLVSGHRYLATRPMLGSESEDAPSGKLPVKIKDYNNLNGDPVAHVDDMPYEKANRFLNEFNNGKLSFDGRVW